MSWEKRIFATAEERADLFPQIDRLIESQRRGWPAYDQAVAALCGMARKELFREEARVVAKSNPRRGVSINASVDPASVARRPCFLCEENLPSEEQGIAFGEFVLFPNPFPVHLRHLTIPLREHCPQRLAGRLNSLLALTEALGPEMILFYNGPRCGASAPDHLHFQACRGDGIPLLEQIPGPGTGAGISPFTCFGRNLILCQAGSQAALVGQLERVLNALARLTGGAEEPMLNLIVRCQGKGFGAIVFPRARHRPACYFAEGQARIAISPAALEMAGLLMIAEPAHLERLDPEVVHSIYREVSIDDGRFGQLVEALT